jgi:hypothetical protein
MRVVPALLICLATLSTVSGALLVLRLNADSGSLLQVINTNRSDHGRRVRQDSSDNIYVVAGRGENTTVLKYAPSGSLVADFRNIGAGSNNVQDALSVATTNNVTFVSVSNACPYYVFSFWNLTCYFSLISLRCIFLI